MKTNKLLNENQFEGKLQNKKQTTDGGMKRVSADQSVFVEK